MFFSISFRARRQRSGLRQLKVNSLRHTRSSLFRVELIVDNRVNRSTLSTNGIRNAVSLQPVLYIGGIPNSNSINLTGSGLNAQGFQGCLASFIVDGRILDYQRALVLNGQVKMNVCSGKFRRYFHCSVGKPSLPSLSLSPFERITAKFSSSQIRQIY